MSTLYSKTESKSLLLMLHILVNGFNQTTFSCNSHQHTHPPPAVCRSHEILSEREKQNRHSFNYVFILKQRTAQTLLTTLIQSLDWRWTKGLLIIWTVLIGELANMLELSDGEKNLKLLVCLNEEIKRRENTEFRESNTNGRTPSLLCYWSLIFRVLNLYFLL